MDLRFTPRDEAFRDEVRTWLEENLKGPFGELRGRGGPGDEHELIEPRRAWEKHLGQAGWACIGWPKEYGGQNASMMQQVIFAEEMTLARAPGRDGFGIRMLAPTLMIHGTEEQKARILPKMATQ